jgi:hypothetical protein
MSSLTLKQILNEVLSQSAFLKQDAFTSASDPDTVQMVSFANKTVNEIVEYISWNMLRKSLEITMVEGQLEYDLPDDFNRYWSESIWKGYGARNVMLPTPERLWSWLKAGNPGNGFRYYAKIIGGKLEFITVSAGDVIQLDYSSNHAVIDSQGTTKERFDNDTDKFLLDDNTLIYGTQAFWKVEKEMPSAVADMQNFRDSIKSDAGRDSPAIVIRSGIPKHDMPYSPPIDRNYLW